MAFSSSLGPEEPDWLHGGMSNKCSQALSLQPPHGSHPTEAGGNNTTDHNPDTHYPNFPQQSTLLPPPNIPTKKH